MRELFRRVWYLVRRSHHQRVLRHEMDAHRELSREDGRPFGNTLRLREEADEAWGWAWLDRLGQDVRFAARLFRRSPAFVLAATLVLGLGVGVNLAAFQLLDAVALSWLPVRSPGAASATTPTWSSTCG